MGQSSFERVGNEVVALLAREGFNEDFINTRQYRSQCLKLQPFGDRARQLIPARPVR
jgi:hypothetical protein